jgi:hypothetical protein
MQVPAFLFLLRRPRTFRRPPFRRWTDLLAALRTPEDTIGDHPSIGEINIIRKLYSNTLFFGLDNDALHPITDATSFPVVIAKYLNTISDLVLLLGYLPIN